MNLKPYQQYSDEDLEAAKAWLSAYMDAQAAKGGTPYIHRFSNGVMQLNYIVTGVGVVTTCASGRNEVEMCDKIDKNWRRALAKEAK